MNFSAKLSLVILIFISLSQVVSADIINNTIGGIIAYDETTNIPIQYNHWDGKGKAILSALTDTISTGPSISWVRLEASHEYNQMLMATQNATNSQVQLYNSQNNTWSNFLTLSNTGTSNQRQFDLAVEDISGNILIVYENSGVANNAFAYRTWNGTSYSAESTFSFAGDALSNFVWIKAIAQKGTDNIMILAQENDTVNTGELNAIVWDGTEFVAASSQEITDSISLTGFENFDFEWESNTSEGLVIYGDSVTTNALYRQYFPNNTWSSSALFLDPSGIHNPKEIELCSDPVSSHVAAMIMDEGNDLTVDIWDGNLISTVTPPSEDTTIEPSSGEVITCAWEKNTSRVMFGFIDAAAAADDEISYLFFNLTHYLNSNNVVVTALENVQVSPEPDINNKFTLHFYESPTTNELIATMVSSTEDLSVLYWNTTHFVIPSGVPIELDIQCLNGLSLCHDFSFDKFDPVPDVINLSVLATVTANTVVNITIQNVTDNIAVDKVIFNITLPNSTVYQVRAVNTIGTTYYFPFNETSATGTYSIVAIVNDTSSHKNINDTQTTSFTVAGGAPLVSIVANITTLEFNTDNLGITFSAESTTLQTTIVNITAPNAINDTLVYQNTTAQNGTIQLSPSQLNQTGTYTASIFANTTSGTSSTTSITFTIQDTRRPSVAISVNDSNIEYGTDTIEINFNSSDYLINATIVNITDPNGILIRRETTATGTIQLSNASLNITGIYTVSIFANDSSGNTNTTSTAFTVQDTRRPSVAISTNTTTVQINSQNIEINFNSSDLNLNSTIVNITAPNGQLIYQNSTASIGIVRLGGTQINQTGTYTVSIFANDSAGNTNTTSLTFLGVTETAPPSVYISVNNSALIFELDNLEINFNATDETLIGTVIVNITDNKSNLIYQNSTAFNGTIHFSPSQLNQTGTYTVSIFANDSAGNSNTTQTIFTVTDNRNPSISISINDSSLELQDENIQITFNSSDTQLNYTIVNITDPQGNLIFRNSTSSGSTISGIASLGTSQINQTGTYTVSIFANDSSGNTNTTSTTFTVQDTRPPSVAISVNDSNIEYGLDTIAINFNATDLQLNSTIVNITAPNGQLIAQSTASSSTIQLSNSSLNQTGTYTVSIFANDSSGNTNTTSTTFLVEDTLAPFISITVNNSNPLLSLESISLTFESRDLHSINATIVNITAPDGSLIYQNTSANTGVIHLSATQINQTGTYTASIFSNDSTGNSNSTQVIFTTVDNRAPLIFISINDTVIEYNRDSIAINLNTSDNELETTIVNITDSKNNLIYQNSTASSQLIQFSASQLNQTGNYTISIFTNDTSGNSNTTNTIFNVVDTSPPAVYISINNSTPEFGIDSIEINFNSSDFLLNITIINITNPSGTLIYQNSTASIGIVELSEQSINSTGTYTVSIFANDSSGNTNTTQVTFTVTDSVNPSTNLTSPLNNTIFNSTQVTFTCNATDNELSTLTLYHNISGTFQQNQTTSISGTSDEASFTISSISEGIYIWNCLANDTSANTDFADNNFTFTIDITPPKINSISSEKVDNDPQNYINITTNVTDNLTQISVVFLQYKLESDTQFTNLTLSKNATSGLYFGGFNATTNGTYNLRIIANDSAQNTATSTFLNISVQTEISWTRTPIVFATVTTNTTNNITLGTLAITNTGDSSIPFNISSDNSTTLFNDSTSFTLAPAEIKNFNINDSIPGRGTKTVTITINATDADPLSLTTTGTIIFEPGQPILSSEFTTPSADSVTKERGQTINIDAELTNMGQGTAKNITFFLQGIPSDWNKTSGNENETSDELETDSSLSISTTYSIPSSASLGTFTIRANATGVNESDVDLRQLSLITTDILEVTIIESTEVSTVPAPAPSGGGGSPSSPTSSVSGGGGSVTRITTGETIYTQETIDVIRGSQDSIPISITNFYENAYMENVKLEVQGFNSQYVTIIPTIDFTKRVPVESKNIVLANTNEELEFFFSIIGSHKIVATNIAKDSATILISSTPTTLTLNIGETKEIDLDDDNYNDLSIYLEKIEKGAAYLKVYKLSFPDPEKINFKESRTYNLSIFAPGYLERDNFNLDIKITADIVAISPTLAGFTTKPLTEFRSLLFRIFEVNPEKVKIDLQQAIKDIEEMKQSGLPTSKAELLLSQAEKSIASSNYEHAADLIDQISRIKSASFEILSIINEVKLSISDAKKHWLNVPQSEQALALAIRALEREDLESALQRAKEAQLIYILETKGKVNFIWFIANYWWAIILGAISLSILGFITYKKYSILIINQRLKDITKEEEALNELIKEAQILHIRDSLNTPEFERTILQYELRINKIHQIRVKLLNKRVSILRTEQEMENITKEEKDLENSMRQSQINYLQKGIISKTRFDREYKQNKDRYADLEAEKEILKEKLEKEKGTKKYKLLKALDTLIIKRLTRKKLYYTESSNSKIVKEKIEKSVLVEKENTKKLEVEVNAHSAIKKDHTPKEIPKHKDHNTQEKDSPARPTVSELIKLYPGAFTEKEKDLALKLENKHQLLPEKKKTKKESLILSQEPRIKRLRELIYKILREKYNIHAYEL